MTLIPLRSLADALKENTMQAHQALEKKFLPVLKSASSVEKYADILRVFYSFYSSAEESIHRFVDINLLPDFPERRKADLLLQDLQASGCETEPDVDQKLLEIESPEQAFGALYVLEGSTLGGSIISKMLKVRVAGISTLFFDGYGYQTQRKWTAFQAVLNSSGFEPVKVIEAANHTFTKFRELIEERYE